MKTKYRIAFGFGVEMVFFISVGGYLANGQWPYAFLSLVFAMIFAGYTGKLIEQDAIEKYKKEVRK